MEVRFQPTRALAVLLAHGVQFVLIGGLAGRAWGSDIDTRDLDICYARDDDNLERLAAALRELGARLRGRGVPDDGPFQLDARTLRAGDAFTFSTDAGSLEVLGVPAGSEGFEDLAQRAREIDFQGHRVLVASIDDLMRMKEAAGRPKDLYALEILGALRDLVDEGDRE